MVNKPVMPALTGMGLPVVIPVKLAQIDIFAMAATIYGNLTCTDMSLFTAISSVTLASMSVAMLEADKFVEPFGHLAAP